MSGQQKKDWKDWHAAFFVAVKMGLLEYSDILEFMPEYQLTAGSLRIDALIIKKNKNIVIEKAIGRHFRSRNIVEYKSPNETFTKENFCKTLGYCFIYASNENIKINDISLTIILSKEPQTVFQNLKDVYGWDILEESAGVYIVVGNTMPFPIKFIDSEKIPETENVWLKNLRKNISVESLNKVFEASKKMEDTAALLAYLDVLIKINPKSLKELKNMKYKTTEEVLIETGWAELLTQHAIERERQQWQAKTQQWQSKEAEYQRELEEARRKLAQYEANGKNT